MHNSKKLVLLVVPFAVALFAAQVFAYPAADGCRTCHPTFQGGPGNALHSMHVGSSQMTNNCQLCHTSGFDIPDINSAADGMSCAGCHITPGLWERHQASSISCAPCHQNWPTPDPEDTLPPHYTRTDVALTDPCESDAALGGEDYSGDNQGLDNDGDTLYDAADPDCETVAVEPSTWGAIKKLYKR
jgi:hypothetical protein